MYILYRTLDEITKLTCAQPYIYSDLSKTYRYTNSKYPVDEDYIYIPMLWNGDVYDAIEEHLQNPNCKGFFISNPLLTEQKYLDLLYKYNPQNVLVVRNTYNTGLQIADINAKAFKPEIIILAGTDGLKELKNKICLNLKVENLNYESHWQAIIDPLLRYKEGEQYVVLETNFDKKTSDSLANLNENSTIVYTKASFKLLNLYRETEEYFAEIAKLTWNNPKVIFASDDNQFLHLTNNLRDRIHFTKNLSTDVLKYFGVENIKEPKHIFTNKFVDSSNSSYSIIQSIRKFIANKKLKNKRKIVVFHAINGLGKYSAKINTDIINEITEDIDSIAIICGAVYTTDMSNKNKKTIFKRLPNLTNDNILAVKKFVEWRSKDADCAYLIISGDKDLCSIV